MKEKNNSFLKISIVAGIFAAIVAAAIIFAGMNSQASGRSDSRTTSGGPSITFGELIARNYADCDEPALSYYPYQALHAADKSEAEALSHRAYCAFDTLSENQRNAIYEVLLSRIPHYAIRNHAWNRLCHDYPSSIHLDDNLVMMGAGGASEINRNDYFVNADGDCVIIKNAEPTIYLPEQRPYSW